MTQFSYASITIDMLFVLYLFTIFRATLWIMNICSYQWHYAYKIPKIIISRTTVLIWCEYLVNQELIDKRHGRKLNNKSFTYHPI